jgi:hypothetical protein
MTGRSRRRREMAPGVDAEERLQGRREGHGA